MENVSRSYKNLVSEGERQLSSAGIKEAKLDSWYLFNYLTGVDRTAYFLHEDREVEKEISDRFFSLIEKRMKRIPIAYLTGTRGFMGLDFRVNEHVLIPEQDTELLVEEALKFSEGKDVLDLCTGSGCIAIALTKLGKPKSVLGSDISEEALKVASSNVSILEEEERTRIRFIKGDMFEKVSGVFDLILSNPPYIETEVIDSLEPEVSVYEPRLALDGDEDGLKFYRQIAKEAPKYLKQGGKLLLEIGSNQAEAVTALLSLQGFQNIRVRKDLAGLDRVIIADRS